jgi:hypothetical protein
VREPQIGLKDRTQTPALVPPHPSYTRFPTDNPAPDGNAGALQGLLEEILNLTVSDSVAQSDKTRGRYKCIPCSIVTWPGCHDAQ